METRTFNPALPLLAFGLATFGLAGLSIVDMLVLRPHDGLVLAAEPAADGLVVREVIPGSGGDRAGMLPGDRILGIGRNKLRRADQAPEALSRFRSGDMVPYLVRRADGVRELAVRLDQRRFVEGTYFYTAALGLSFFFVGLFVLIRQPGLRASQVFFMLCGLFLLFLVCRLRPPSYSPVNGLILGIGSLAFLFLPPTFFHFYLIFPRPVALNALSRRRWAQPLRRLGGYAWLLVYLVPPAVFCATALLRPGQDPAGLIHGAPPANWWLLAVYIVLGLTALGVNTRHLDEPRERRGALLVLAGSLFGLVPFLVASLVLSASLHSGVFFFAGVMPLVLVPITFTYAVVRFQLLDIRVILRRSLLYTVTTALVTGIYAGGIAAFNSLFRDTSLAASAYFPIFLALAIVLLFEPLRRQMQELIDRYFFAERYRLQHAMVELGEAMTAQLDLQAVVQELVEKLPQLLGLRFAALYLLRGAPPASPRHLYRIAGPEGLPSRLPDLPELYSQLRRRGLTRIHQLGSLALRSPEVARLVEEMAAAGVEAVGGLHSPRRPLGLVLLSEKEGHLLLGQEELDLLQGLLHQAAVALETSLLLEERTQRAELERELEIAASIQAQLLPESLKFAAGWEVAAVCRPARIVGGDFYAQLPAPGGESTAVVYGDVSGKSVSGALMMMAAHEALYALAMTQPQPSELFTLANRRVYGLGRRSFVALGYFSAHQSSAQSSAEGGAHGDVNHDGRLTYLVAGQPPPLWRRGDGTVTELPLPEHRIPVGALAGGAYRALEVVVAPGDLVLGYSDGVTDARSPAGDVFGSERLHDVVARAAGDPRRLIREVLDAVEAFTENGAQYDDLTLVAVCRRPENG